LLGALDVADEERVIARLMLGLQPALEPADGAGEQRASRPLPDLDPVPERNRRHSAGEVLRERDLIGSEDRDSEATRSAQQLVQRRLPSDRDRDERWLERNGHERGNGQPEPLAFAVDGDDADPDRVAAHHLAELVAARHGDDLTDRTWLDGLAERVAGEELLLYGVLLQIEFLVVRRERVRFPVDVGRDARADDRGAVALA
jgi:hypothetical protein